METIFKPEHQIVDETVLIAQFMGYEVGDYQKQGKPIFTRHKYAKTIGEQKELWQGLDLQFTGRFTERVKYPFNTDWNYLMPIIHQIESLGYTVTIAGISCKITKVLDIQNPIVSWVLGNKSKKIELVYTTVIEFIKWYMNPKNKLTN